MSPAPAADNISNTESSDMFDSNTWLFQLGEYSEAARPTQNIWFDKYSFYPWWIDRRLLLRDIDVTCLMSFPSYSLWSPCVVVIVRPEDGNMHSIGFYHTIILGKYSFNFVNLTSST